MNIYCVCVCVGGGFHGMFSYDVISAVGDFEVCLSEKVGNVSGFFTCVGECGPSFPRCF